MKRLIFTLATLSCFISCKKESTIPQKKHQTIIDITKISYFDAETASFTLYKSDTINGLVYNPKYIVSEVTYEVFRMLDTTQKGYNMTYHIAKIKKVSELVNGAEGGLTKVSAEIRDFNNPKKIEFIIDETESDEIQFEPNLYRIIAHGCCESSGWIKVYNYQQKLITEGEPSVIYSKYPVW
ncbi:MAG: hypothetical protein AB8B65_14845 [Kordia sp.]|uniref:hypothetical protein n=1 Tax=Kordia sp. TaxID=1965332 RepID=UPI00385FDFEC